MVVEVFKKKKTKEDNIMNVVEKYLGSTTNNDSFEQLASQSGKSNSKPESVLC